MNFINHFNKFGEKIALIDEKETVSYADLMTRCKAFSTQLPSKRSFIALGCMNTIETVVAYLSCLINNHAVLLYDEKMDATLLSRLLQTYKPSVCYAEKKLQYLNDANQDGSCDSGLHQDLALCLSTSGSTGSPKLVKLTKKNIEANTQSIVTYLQLSPTDVAITSLPLHYSFGLSILNTHLAVGASIVLTEESIVTRAFWDIFNQHRVTTFAGVPSHYEMIHKLRILHTKPFHLKTLMQAGGRLSLPLVQIFSNYALKYEINFFIMYGQTEACARMAYLPPHLVHDKPDAIGLPIPGGAFYLIDSEGQKIQAPEHIGELVYCGENVMMGYATQRKDLEKPDELKGILHTGDLAKFDSDYIYYIKGRLKRFLKIHGNRFSLDELESHLQHYGECICGGVDNQLIVLLKEESLIDTIADILSKKYRLHHTNYRILYRSDFPTSASGKIQYHHLEALAL